MVQPMKDSEGRSRREAARLARQEAPSVSLVVLSAADDRDTWQAMDVVFPVAAEMSAELVVVLRESSATALWDRVAAEGGSAVCVPAASTRTEMCDSAMAVVCGDIVLFREATAVCASRRRATRTEKADQGAGAVMEQSVALRVEADADTTSASAASSDRVAGRGALPGDTPVLRANDRDKIAAAG